MVNTYSQACTEILIILNKFFSEEELSIIPKEKIAFFEKNKDKNYKYEIDENKPFEQQLSRMTSSILVSLYRDYFATEKQKEVLKELLEKNDKRLNLELSKRSNNIFKIRNKEKEESVNIKKELIIKEKQTLFRKLINIIKGWFKK